MTLDSRWWYLSKMVEIALSLKKKSTYPLRWGAFTMGSVDIFVNPAGTWKSAFAWYWSTDIPTWPWVIWVLKKFDRIIHLLFWIPSSLPDVDGIEFSLICHQIDIFVHCWYGWKSDVHHPKSIDVQRIGWTVTATLEGKVHHIPLRFQNYKKE